MHGVLADSAAVITAVGIAAASMLTATAGFVQTMRASRRVVESQRGIHEVTARVADRTDEQTAMIDKIAHRQEDQERTMRSYMESVNAMLGGLADVSQLAVPFMADYRERHPDLYGGGRK